MREKMFRSISEMARFYGVHPNTIRKYMRKYGISLSGNSWKVPPKDFVEWFDELYRKGVLKQNSYPLVLPNGRVMLKSLAKKYGISYTRVRTAFRNWLFDTGQATYDNYYDVVDKYRWKNGVIYVPKEFEAYLVEKYKELLVYTV